MAITKNLIDKFVEATNDSNNAKSESNLYGTVKIIDGDTFVQIDGSEILTPMPTVTTAKEGDRVKVEIKDHTAVIVGNMTSPSAMNSTVEALDLRVQSVYADVGTFHTLLADKATIGELNAAKAEITELLAGKVTADELEAEIAKIDELIAKKVSTDIFDAKMASVDTLIADRATVGELSAAKADIINLNAEMADIVSLVADKASVGELNAVKADITNLNANKANVTDLDAANANIGKLDASVGKIDTMIFGSASGTTIQTSFANAVIAQLGNAQIKSAMIEDISASKIKAGDILTNNVRVMSEDGSLVISDETLQISDGTRVRVQIGKDAANDYSINIWDASGNLMFSKGGITDAAIKNAIIRNDMVAANANISASKLDIDSLFTEINNSSKTIKSTKVYLDEKGQTLDAAFTSMTTDVNGIRGTVESQGTQISVMQGQIANKIWQTDIDTTIDKLEIGGRNFVRKLPDYTSGAHGITVKLEGYDYTISGTNTYANSNYGVGGHWLPSSHLALEPGETYTLSTTNPLPPGLYLGWNGMNSSGTQVELGYLYGDGSRKSLTFTVPLDYQSFTTGFFGVDIRSCGTVNVTFRIKLEKGNKATDWTPAPEDVEGEISTLNTKYSEVKQTVNGLSTTVAAHTTQISNKADGSEVTAVTSRVSSLEQNLDGFKSTVSNTYTTKTEFDNLEIGGRNLLRFTKDLPIGTVCPPEYADGYSSFAGVYTNLIGTADGLKIIRSASLDSISIWVPIVSLGCIDNGETITLSFDYRTNTSNAGKLYFMQSSGLNISTNMPELTISETEWQHYKWTFSHPEANVRTLNSLLLFYGVTSSTDWIEVKKGSLKLEKGNKATDWTPAPEDVEGKISTVSNKVSTLEQSVDGFKATVSSTYATKSDLDTTNSKLPWVTQGWVDASAYDPNYWIPFLGNGIPSNIYGRFYVSVALNSGTKPSWSTHDSGFSVEFDVEAKGSAWGTSPEHAIIHKNTCAHCTGGSPVSLFAHMQTSSPILYLRGGGKYYVRTNYECHWTAYPDGWTWMWEDTVVSTYPPYASRPAPYGDELGTKAEINLLSDRISANVTETTALGTRMSTVEQKADGLTVSLSNTQTQLDNLEIGGRNLFPDSDYVRTTTRFYSINVYDILKPYVGRSVVISFDMKLNDSSFLGRGIMVYPYQNNGISINTPISVYPTTEYQRFAFRAVVYNWGDNGIYSKGAIGFYDSVGENNYSFKNIKIELGNKPTDWTPAVEDVNSSIANSAKTATNYLNFSNGGLVVGDMTASTLGNNVLIDNDSVDIRNGTTVVASYKADKIELGKNSRNAVIDLCSGTGQIKNINDDVNEEWNRLGIISGEGGGGSVEISSNQFSAGTYFENVTNDWGSTSIYSSSYSPWKTGNSNTHAVISLNTDRKTPIGLRSINMMDMDDGIIQMISSYKGFEGDDTKHAALTMGKQDQYGHTGWYGVGISTVNIAGNFNYAFYADGAASYIGLPSSGILYIPYYQSGDGIDYSGASTKTFYTSGFVTNSGKDVYFTIPLSKPAVAVSSIYAESSYGFQLRQNGNYTHGSGASAWAKPSSYECHLTGDGNAITVIAKFATTTNVVNNAPVGIRWSGVIGFDVAG